MSINLTVSILDSSNYQEAITLLTNVIKANSSDLDDISWDCTTYPKNEYVVIESTLPYEVRDKGSYIPTYDDNSYMSFSVSPDKTYYVIVKGNRLIPNYTESFKDLQRQVDDLTHEDDYSILIVTENLILSIEKDW